MNIQTKSFIVEQIKMAKVKISKLGIAGDFEVTLSKRHNMTHTIVGINYASHSLYSFETWFSKMAFDVKYYSQIRYLTSYLVFPTERIP